MNNYYYQIKGQSENDYGGSWHWPPVFSGMVEAKDRKIARSKIEEEYGRKFPLRVLSKDLVKEHYLLSIKEILSDDERTLSLFEAKACLYCTSKFRVIDKYNDHDEMNKGGTFCSHQCRGKHDAENRLVSSPNEMQIGASAYIYKISNKLNGMVYIGQTTQVFTLRWYQHFYHNGSCKFHKAIKGSELTDWDFTLVELVKPPADCDRKRFVSEREMHWINKFDSIKNGYNSVPSIKQKEKVNQD